MSRVTVYSTASCPVCSRTKAMLQKWEIAFDEIPIDRDDEAKRKFLEVTPAVPPKEPTGVLRLHTPGGYRLDVPRGMDGDTLKIVLKTLEPA